MRRVVRIVQIWVGTMVALIAIYGFIPSSIKTNNNIDPNNWSLQVWTSILLVLLLISIIAERYWENANENVGVKTRTNNGTILNVGRDFRGKLIVNPTAENDRQNVQKQIDLEKIRIGNGWQKAPLPDRFYNVHESVCVFTLVNESGHDLNHCFILLDSLQSRNAELNEPWRIISEDFPKPFCWNVTETYDGGKISIGHDNRASFYLTKETNLPASMGTETKIIFNDDEECLLYGGWEHHLVISIKAKDENDRNISIKYDFHLETNTSGGVFVNSIGRYKNSEDKKPMDGKKKITISNVLIKMLNKFKG